MTAPAPKCHSPLRLLALGVAAIGVLVVAWAGDLLPPDRGQRPGSLAPAAGDRRRGRAGRVVLGERPLDRGEWVASRLPGARILFGQQHTAVGRTPKVTGGIVISGSRLTTADFSVAMAAVTSDQLSRDTQFDGYIMETYKYSHAHSA